MPITIKTRIKPAPAAVPEKDTPQGIFLDQYLNRSLVKRVGFCADAMRDIDAWVRQSLTTTPVHETGGFLLGRYADTNNAQWDIDILQFCPARSVAFSAPNRLAFGAAAIQELDVAMEAAPELSLLGWFHTHPGLTPYLSKMDLSIHNGFFTAPWQIAVVLDPLTPGFDTGIFSRQPDGRMNNKAQYPGNWIHWTEIQHALPPQLIPLF